MSEILNIDNTKSVPFIEEILRPDENRYMMFPIKYHDVWDLYQKSIDCMWKHQDIDLSKDLNDWNALNKDYLNFFGWEPEEICRDNERGDSIRD